MIDKRKHWQKVFLVCFGLFAGTAVCMKWLENDFRYNGNIFTIIGLEISYPAEKIRMIFSGLDDKVRSLLRYQLYIDFLFMAAVYPGIASLCMIGYHKNKRWGLKKLLLVFAALQGLAWLCDIFENRYLLKWISDPGAIGELGFYHALVWTKWLVALSGLTAALLSLFRRTNSPNPAKS